MSSAPRKSVLVLGARGATAANGPANAGWNADKVRNAVQEEMKLVEAAGFDATVYFVDIEKSTTIDELRQIYKTKTFDGVSIGFGLRSAAPFTALFEQLVNLFVHEQQPPPKMMFAIAPDKLVETLERAFPGSF